MTAYGGELGDWSVLKTSFKGTLPLIKANDSLLAPVSLTSIDFYEDDGQLEIVTNCGFYFDSYDTGSNPSISALCFWFCVQIFAQSTSVSTSAISSENSVAALVETAASQIVSPPADSGEQDVLSDDREVVPNAELNAVAAVDEVAVDTGDS